MFTKSARFYDQLYHFVDYEEAAARVRARLREASPEARTLLDVGCGTGRHLEHLARDYEVSGLDLSPELLAAARARCPTVPLYEGDMTGFDLGTTFDVITCLFSAIAYVRTLENLRRSLATFARHLNPGGVVL